MKDKAIQELIDLYSSGKLNEVEKKWYCIKKNYTFILYYCDKNQVEVESIPNSRGGELNGVSIHSVRLPGRSAHHEIIFGAAGQTLSLKHDTLDRECYMPGVIQTVDYVCKNHSFVVGLENILGI